jgi:hypothetical protein
MLSKPRCDPLLFFSPISIPYFPTTAFPSQAAQKKIPRPLQPTHIQPMRTPPAPSPPAPWPHVSPATLPPANPLTPLSYLNRHSQILPNIASAKPSTTISRTRNEPAPRYPPAPPDPSSRESSEYHSTGGMSSGAGRPRWTCSAKRTLPADHPPAIRRPKHTTRPPFSPPPKRRRRPTK